jgi:hypothetical protein
MCIDRGKALMCFAFCARCAFFVYFCRGRSLHRVVFYCLSHGCLICPLAADGAISFLVLDTRRYTGIYIFDFIDTYFILSLAVVWGGKKRHLTDARSVERLSRRFERTGVHVCEC